MPPSLREYKDSLLYQETSEPYVRGLDTALGVLKTAAVSFENLTNNSDWDRFLSLIYAQLDTAKKERDSALLKCGGAVGDALEHARLQYQFFHGQVTAIEHLVTLPRQIVAAYDDVKQLRPSSSP